MPSPQFFNVQPVEDALKHLFDHWQPVPGVEQVLTYSAVNRVVAYDVHSPSNIPSFRKSTVDGYAVRADDTYGATQSLPAYLKPVGEIMMGIAPEFVLDVGETVHIHTGGMLPDTANAVVMIEHTQTINATEIEVLKAVAPGENVIQIGEDVREGGVILRQYHRIRSQDIGGLLAVGITEVTVLKQPRIGILSCGDELVEPAETPLPGQIRDINAYTLSALVENTGGISVRLGIAPDSLNGYISYTEKAFTECDILILTAGSSVSARDLTRDVINRLGDPGILQHGLATKPGKPTILAVCSGKPVIGLPGNPVSALLVAHQILPNLIARYVQQSVNKPNTISATLLTNIASLTGREDWVPVSLTYEAGKKATAQPIFGKSNLIYTLIKADGLVCVPLNSGGLLAGTMVEVTPF